MTFFANTKEFLTQFGDFSAKSFFDPIHLDDSKVGFSIKRFYPDGIRYKPAISQKSKKPDNVAALWVVYTHPDDSRKSVPESKVPLRIRIANMSLYRMKHWDYDFNDNDGDCPSKDSYEASAATPKPIDLDYPGEYFFNHIDNTFLDSKGNSISGLDILERVFQDHCKTVHLLWGLQLRIKLLAQDNFAGFLGVLKSVLIFILKHIFGRTIEDDDAMAGLFKMYRPEAMKKYTEDSLDIWGYKASKQVIVVFCTFAIISSYIRYKFEIKDDYWSSVGASEFLSLIHGLFSVWFLDVIVPWLLFWIINFIIWLKTKVLFIKISP
jgi:hypothetical protein